jgi:Tol biopolymer transport system component
MRTRVHSTALRSIGAVLLLAAAALLRPAPAAAQYFGRNKVQYEDFDFRVLQLPHWDLYFYPGEEASIADVSRMAERWYERYARTFQHEFEKSKPLIVYADQPDWQQTNTLEGFIEEGTGGVTESVKNRVIMPQTGSYHDTDHVLGHEMVHAFQYNIAQSRRGGGQQGLNTMPLWVVEGMAEWFSIGRDHPLTGMWLRDAVRQNDFPTIKDLTKGGKYFPYRFGQGLLGYIGGTYGDDAVVQLFRRSVRIGFQPAIEQVLGVDHDTLSAQWKRAVQKAYAPLLVDRTAPDSTGTSLITAKQNGGSMNIGPALSPDGKYLAYLSEQDLFSVDLFMADAHTGKRIRKLESATSNPHADAIRYVESSGTWSPDSKYFAFSVYLDGDNAIDIVNADDGSEWKLLKPLVNGMINNPSWSPDGRTIAFSGTVGGISDLWTVDVMTGQAKQLTHDKNGDFQPDWSPDGKTIVFTSDRGPETDFAKLTYSEWRLSFYDMATGEVRTPDMLGNVRHSNPVYGPNGDVYFLSDGDGFSDIYRYRPANGSIERITKIATGVSGHTPLAPALSISRTTGELAFTVFNHFEFHINRLGANPPGTPQAPFTAEEQLGQMIPPFNPDRYSRVAEYHADPNTGLESPGTFKPETAKPYKPALALDYVGQPSIGVGTDRFGNYVGGGAAAYFSDMLGNRVVGAAIQAQGTVKDIGGALFYQDVGHRWNWGVGVSHTPYVISYVTQDQDAGGTYLGEILNRLYVSSATGLLSYPFSQTRRFEAQAGFTRYASNTQIQKYYYDEFGRIYDRQDSDLCTGGQDVLGTCFAPLDLVTSSAAIVHDNSFFGFTSPVRGGRSRFEVGATAGSVQFLTLTADWRRYLGLNKNLTFAMRGLHFGRYGNLSEHSDVLQPTYLGYEYYIRGYDYQSFTPTECIDSQTKSIPGDSCPVRNRLFGNKLALASAEFRVPLLGVEQYGLIKFPFLPTELVAFADGGVAWDNTLNSTTQSQIGTSTLDTPVDWSLSRSASAHVPVFSTGVGARFNVLGFMVLEAYYAYPWQRPDKGAHWGFQIAPGW